MSESGAAAQAPTLPRLPDRRGPSRGDVRRGELLAALERLLHDRPLAEIGVGDITEAAGVGRSAFYFYFPSKEAAVTDLLGDFAQEILGGAAGFLTPGGRRDRDSMREALAGTVRAWGEHRHLVVATLDARAGDERVRELWDTWMALFVAPVATAIAEERATGAAPTGPEPELLARLLLCMNERALEHHVRERAGDAASEQLVDALTTVWLNAIYGGSA